MNPNACIVIRDGAPSIRQPTKPFKTGKLPFPSPHAAASDVGPPSDGRCEMR
jgi:hypothetical protein